MCKRVFSLIMAGVLTVGLLMGCGSNFEDTKNDYTVQSEQVTDEQKLREEPYAQTETEMTLECVLPPENQAIYEAYLGEYAGSDYLYAYCDYDGDGVWELYLRRNEASRPYGRVMKYSRGGVKYLESGVVSQEYLEGLEWKEIPEEKFTESEEMTHGGIYVYTAQSPDDKEFWYAEEESFLAQYGFWGKEPFYEYILSDGTKRLVLYYDEETGLGCGIRYFERDPSDMMTSGTYGFSFQGLSEENMEGGLARDYTSFESVDGTVVSELGIGGLDEKTEYDDSGKISHYEANGVVEEGRETELILWMDYQYHPNGKLAERFYYHNPYVFGTWYTTWQSYFDTQGRLEHEYIYVTHGWMDYYYIYLDEGKRPAYILYLDDNLGWWIPEFVKCE